MCQPVGEFTKASSVVDSDWTAGKKSAIWGGANNVAFPTSALEKVALKKRKLRGLNKGTNKKHYGFITLFINVLPPSTMIFLKSTLLYFCQLCSL